MHRSPQSQELQQPPARVAPVAETYFGTTVVDPYRWLEASDDPEAEAWLQAQAASTETFLDRHTLRQTLLERITALNAAGVRISNPQLTSSSIFYRRRAVDQQADTLVVRSIGGGPERLLVDPNQIDASGSTTLDWFVPSPDGRWVAYGLSEGGTDDSTLRVLDVAQGVPLDVAIPHVRYGRLSWLPDRRGFVYLRFPALPADAPASDQGLDSVIALHRLGADPTTDQAVLGRTITPTVALERHDLPLITCAG